MVCGWEGEEKMTENPFILILEKTKKAQSEFLMEDGVYDLLAEIEQIAINETVKSGVFGKMSKSSDAG